MRGPGWILKGPLLFLFSFFLLAICLTPWQTHLSSFLHIEWTHRKSSFFSIWSWKKLHILKFKLFQFEKVKVLVILCDSLCPTLCNTMDCSPPGSTIHGILQARILEWVAIPFSRGSSQPRNRNHVSHIAGRFSTIWEAPGFCLFLGSSLSLFKILTGG